MANNNGVTYHSGIGYIGNDDEYNVLAVSEIGVPKYVKNRELLYKSSAYAEGETSIDPSKTISSWYESDGVVTIETQDIQLDKSQVDGLEDDLSHCITSISVNGGEPVTTEDGTVNLVVSGGGGTVDIATTTRAGIVKVGEGLSVTGDGTLSVTADIPDVEIATANRAGIVKIGSGLEITGDGTLSAVGSGGTVSELYWVRAQNTLTASIQDVPSDIFVYAGRFYAHQFYVNSDKSLKTNITEVPEDSIRKVDNVKIVEFDWKSSGDHSVGVIAQEVKDAGLDNVISTGSDNKLSVDYIQLLLLKVASLERKVADLEKRLSKQ